MNEKLAIGLSFAVLFLSVSLPAFAQGGNIGGISVRAFGDKHWKSPVANFSALPAAGNSIADTRRTLDNGEEYWWNGSTWINAGIQGPQGIQGVPGVAGIAGTQGAQGTAGADGKTVRYGTGAPSSGLGVDGDFYIDTATVSIFGPKASGAWGSGTSLVGPQGTTGATGVQGATGATGAQGPQGTQGVQGPAGAQGATGSAGVNGSTWYSGSVTPSSGTGTNGDYYFRTASGDVYTKSAGSWSIIANLIGPAGALGATGATGAQGVKGDTGLTGGTGPTGATGPSGVIAATAPITYDSGTQTVSIVVTPSNPGGAVALQASTPGTSQTGNVNVSGFGLFGTVILNGGVRIKNDNGTLSIRTANDGGYATLISNLIAILGDDGSYTSKLESGSSGGLVLANGAKVWLSNVASLGGVTSGDAAIERAGVGVVKITSEVQLDAVVFSCGAIGTCGSGQKGVVRCAVDGSLCNCNGSIWTPTPLTGTCN